VKTLLCLTLLIGTTAAQASSSIDPARSFSWGANIGWVDWHPSAVHGAQVSEFICAGSLYSANIGWIHLGNGHPASGIRYRNDSGTDYGVNQDGYGNLRGLAWAANAGWIQFEEQGAPKVDLQTGRLTGLAYGANVGWIQLGNASFGVRVATIAPGADTDGDGIPDAWERAWAGNLTQFNATSDSDGDGQSDLEEYLADTAPLDPADALRIVDFSVGKDHGLAKITWPARPTRLYRVQSRRDLSLGEQWTDLEGAARFFPESASFSVPASAPSQLFRVQALRPLAP
jgi:hypothetical protein